MTPKDVDARNRETSAREVAEWNQTPPDRYFAYVRLTDASFTTWMGDVLGVITHIGPQVRDNFGGRRRSIRVRGTNGVLYHGWYFESAGDYARIKRTVS